ncbi:MAG: LysR substrate-binding domain-containing protein, partial [Mitsuokella jalaludinii]
EPFIRLQPTRQMAEVYEKLCESSGAKPQVIFEANSIIEASELCAAGLGATLVTDMLVQSWRWKEQAFFFELEEEVEDRQLLAVCSKQRFIDFLRAD